MIKVYELYDGPLDGLEVPIPTGQQLFKKVYENQVLVYELDTKTMRYKFKCYEPVKK